MDRRNKKRKTLLVGTYVAAAAAATATATATAAALSYMCAFVSRETDEEGSEERGENILKGSSIN